MENLTKPVVKNWASRRPCNQTLELTYLASQLMTAWSNEC